MRSQLGGKLSRRSDVPRGARRVLHQPSETMKKPPNRDRERGLMSSVMPPGGAGAHPRRWLLLCLPFANDALPSSGDARDELLLQDLFCCCSPCENSSSRRRQNVESSHSGAPSHRHSRDPGAGACWRSLGAFPQALRLSEVASLLPATPPESRRRRNFMSRQLAGKHQKLQLG